MTPLAVAAIAVDTVLSEGSPAAHLRYKTPEGKFIAQQELLCTAVVQKGGDEEIQAEQEERDLAQMHGFMRQLRARANWEESRQAGL
ncbi:hypothetical protein MMC29_003692 [Sticta canariensis]|nr:hypothetical protein [Sticta canariensis]